jgi:hypothetical protein
MNVLMGNDPPVVLRVRGGCVLLNRRRLAPTLIGVHDWRRADA